MALRTRVFGRLLKLSETGIEEVVDLPAHRAKRAKLQRTAVGGLIFGRPDPSASVEEIVRRHGAARLGAPAEGRDRAAAVRRQLPRRRLGAGQPRAVGLAREPHRGAQPGRRGVAVLPARARAPVPGRGRRRERRRWPGSSSTPTSSASPPSGSPSWATAPAATSPPSWRCWPATPAVRRLRAQVLIYPGVEMYDRWPSEDRNADAPVLTSANMRAFARLYLGDQYGTEDFRASPIRAVVARRSAEGVHPDRRARPAARQRQLATATRSSRRACRCGTSSTTARSTAS